MYFATNVEPKMGEENYCNGFMEIIGEKGKKTRVMRLGNCARE